MATIPRSTLMRGVTSRNLSVYIPIQSEREEEEEDYVSYADATYNPNTLTSGDINKDVEGAQRMYTLGKEVKISKPEENPVCQPVGAPFIIVKHNGVAYATFTNQPVSCQAGGKRHNKTKKSANTKKSIKARRTRRTRRTMRTNRKNRHSSRRRN